MIKSNDDRIISKEYVNSVGKFVPGPVFIKPFEPFTSECPEALTKECKSSSLGIMPHEQHFRG